MNPIHTSAVVYEDTLLYGVNYTTGELGSPGSQLESLTIRNELRLGSFKLCSNQNEALAVSPAVPFIPTCENRRFFPIRLSGR